MANHLANGPSAWMMDGSLPSIAQLVPTINRGAMIQFLDPFFAFSFMSPAEVPFFLLYAARW